MTQLHLGDEGAMSHKEYFSDAVGLREDYRTAHRRAGDTGYQTFLPETCYECWQQKLSIEEAYQVTPTEPDQEITDER